MLAVAPLVAAVGTASANTELVPAARLAIPYWDISAGRNTLLLLTNVSRAVDLRGAAFHGEVHIEWYNKDCSRTDIPVQLSPEDIDQLNLSNPATNLPGTQGYADIDVRNVASNVGTSLQYNVLLGTVVVSDSVSDFVIAYPAASDIGSSSTGVGGNIVTRNIDGSGRALVWTGSYEPFPSRVFVPMFFAEGGPTNTQSLLAIAALPNGNWGQGALGEAPGQDVTTFVPGGPASTTLISANTQVYDGCENRQSKPISGHYILGSLGSLFGPNVTQTPPWKNILPNDCHGAQNFPHVDEFSGASVGWIDIPNTTDPSIGDSGDEFDRGMVGVLIENADSIGPSPATQQGDVTRLWGDPAAGFRGGVYTNVDGVSHCDINPAIITLNATLPRC
jgi:hypothetical protein